jgi:hypothetical protein
MEVWGADISSIEEKNDMRAAWMGTIFQAWLAVKNELIQKRHI